MFPEEKSMCLHKSDENFCLMYHQQQNKWYPKGFHLLISKLHSILALLNLLGHNNITISYYVQVNSLRLKSNVASKWTSKLLWGYHLLSS